MNKKSCSKKFYVEKNKYRNMIWESKLYKYFFHTYICCTHDEQS